MTTTIRLTAAQALVRYLTAQLTEDGEPFIAGVWAIFGHGNVAGLGEALYASRDAIPTYRGHNEQTMAHAAIAYSKQLARKPGDGGDVVHRAGGHEYGDGRGAGPCEPLAGFAVAGRCLCEPRPRPGVATDRGFRRRHGQRE